MSDVQRQNEKSIRRLKPGDVVTMSTESHKHWAIYVGGGNIIHMAGARCNGHEVVIQADSLLTVAKDIVIESFPKPYSSREVVKRANDKLGSIRYEADLFQSCEHFVYWCQYGQMKPTKTYERNSKTYPIDGKKQFLECHHFNLLRTLEPGDIIKISRTFFNHWGIYVGNNSVVHVSVCNSGNSLTSTGLPVSNIFREPRMEAVVKQSFYRVVGDDYAECSSKNDSHKRPLPQASIVLNATSEIGPIQYQPLYKNCEHFVNKCRYGQEKSSQTQAAVLGLGAASGYAGFLLAGPIGAIAATGFSLYKLYQHAQKNTPEDVKKRNTYFHQF